MRRVGTILLALLVSAWLSAHLRAQEVNDASSKPSNAQVDQDKASSSGETVSRPSSSKATVEISADSYEAYRKYRDSQSAPAFSIVSVFLEGSIGEGRALLEAHIRVLIHRDDEWVKVSLGMGEATTRGEVVYEGSGKWRPELREPGQVWWFKGEGDHTLILPISVDALKLVPGRRLLLSIPPTAVSRLKLRVPVPNDLLSIKPIRNKKPRTSVVNETISEVEVFGLGTLLDLQWEQLSSQEVADDTLESTTSMVLSPAGSLVRLEATQTIRAQSTSISELIVQLPSDFELVGLEAGGKQLRDVTFNESTNIATVPLPEDSGPRIELNWLLEAKFPSGDGSLVLEGFDVTNAIKQSGDIRIKEFDGYKVSSIDNENRYVYRQDGSGLLESEQIAAAFRFSKQPFLLTINLEQIEPLAGVKPSLFLKFAGNADGRVRAELDARYDFRVLENGGAIEEVELNWPNWSQQGWSIEFPESLKQIKPFDVNEFQDQDMIHIPLLKPRTGEFDLQIKAVREIDPVDEWFDVTLPVVAVLQVERSALFVTGVENIGVSMRSKPGTSFTPIPARVEAQVNLPEDFGDTPRLKFYVRQDAHAFEGNVTVHEQSLQADTTANVFVRENRLIVKQRISYDVKYEEMLRMRLRVPAGIGGGVEFFADDDAASDDKAEATGTRLDSESTGREGGTMRHVRVNLPPASRLGIVQVVARYAVDRPQSAVPADNDEITIPLLQSTDVEFDSSICRFRRDGEFVAHISDETWQRRLSSDEWSTWRSIGEHAEIPLTLASAPAKTSQRFAIRRALLTSSLSAGGNVESYGRYVIVGDVSEIVVGFPSTIVRRRIWWNETELSHDSLSEGPPGSGDVRIAIPDGVSSDSNLLTIEFHSSEPLDTTFAPRVLFGPEFPSHVWTDDVLWKVVLPWNEHLFTVPVGYTPRFRWERNGVFWNRDCDPEYESESQWLQHLRGPKELEGVIEGNSYAFTRIGPAAHMEFRALSAQTVVAIGAGIALAAGIMLVKVPATRSALSLLSAAWVLSVLAQWYSEPMELLLQPAALGVVLAGVAAYIEHSFKQPSMVPGVPVTSPSDFVLPTSASSYVEHPAAYGAGSEEPTSVRPIGPSAQEPVSSSSSELSGPA